MHSGLETDLVGKECVEKHVLQEQADDRLIELLKAHGRWTDPS